MCVTTFLHDSELNVPTSNTDLNDLLKEVREATGKDWQILERNREVRQWPWKFKHQTVKSYELYVYVGGMGPWQQINFYSSTSGSSINLVSPVEPIMMYLMGIMSGVRCERMKNAAE